MFIICPKGLALAPFRFLRSKIIFEFVLWLWSGISYLQYIMVREFGRSGEFLSHKKSSIFGTVKKSLNFPLFALLLLLRSWIESAARLLLHHRYVTRLFTEMESVVILFFAETRIFQPLSWWFLFDEIVDIFVTRITNNAKRHIHWIYRELKRGDIFTAYNLKF